MLFRFVLWVECVVWDGLGVIVRVLCVILSTLLAWVGYGLELCLKLVVRGRWYILEVSDLFLAQVHTEDGPSTSIRFLENLV